MTRCDKIGKYRTRMSQDFQFESFKMSRNATATTVKYTDNKDILMNFVFIEFLVE